MVLRRCPVIALKTEWYGGYRMSIMRLIIRPPKVVSKKVMAFFVEM
jgi:hypothetical protein